MSERLYTIHQGFHIRDEYGGFVIPDFQRGLVWTDAQKSSFIESVFLELPIGTYCFHEEIGDKVEFILLDGQQRWNAIFEFADDKVSIFDGQYSWSTLTDRERTKFKQSGFSARAVQGLTRDEQHDVFRRLAYGGTPNNGFTVEQAEVLARVAGHFMEGVKHGWVNEDMSYALFKEEFEACGLGIVYRDPGPVVASTL